MLGWSVGLAAAVAHLFGGVGAPSSVFRSLAPKDPSSVQLIVRISTGIGPAEKSTVWEGQKARRFAQAVDALPPEPSGVVSCPMGLPTSTAVFTFKSGQVLHLETDGCYDIGRQTSGGTLVDRHRLAGWPRLVFIEHRL